MQETFPKPRREAVLLVSPELLIEMVKPGSGCLTRVVKNPVPADARLERVGHGLDGELRVVISSATFEIIDAGARVPELPIPHVQLVFGVELAEEARARANSIDSEWGVTHHDAALLRRLADAIDPDRLARVVLEGVRR